MRLSSAKHLRRKMVSLRNSKPGRKTTFIADEELDGHSFTGCNGFWTIQKRNKFKHQASQLDSFEGTMRHLSKEQLLRSYLECLSSSPEILGQKINQTLSSQSFRVATLFLEYYRTQPDLKSYTLVHELQSNEYAIRHPSGMLTFDKDDIARYAHADHTEMLWEASNSSIFAAAIEILTSDEGIGLKNFNTIAAIKNCGFLLNLTHKERFVTARCELDVSLPLLSGSENVNIASVELVVNFYPFLQKVEMYCANLVPMVSTPDDLDSIVECYRSAPRQQGISMLQQTLKEQFRTQCKGLRMRLDNRETE